MNNPWSPPSFDWTYGEEPATRDAVQEIKEAVELHLSNRDALTAAVPPVGDIDVEVFRQAELAFEDSQAQLFRLIEDALLIHPEKLGRALTC